MSMSKALALEKAQQAVDNLERSVAELKTKGAPSTAIAEYERYLEKAQRALARLRPARRP